MSRAFHELGGFAPQLLILLMGKRFKNKKTGEYTNLDKITMTYAELENIYNQGMSEGMKKLVAAGMRSQAKDGITKPRIIRAWDDLLAKGFVEIIHTGGAWKQDKSIYAFREDWRWWKPGQVIRERAPDTREGRGFLKPKKIKESRTETLPIHTHENVTHTYPSNARLG